MQFTIQSKNDPMQHNKNVSPLQNIQPRTILATPQYPRETENQEPPANKMRWGQPIWFFFHTIAQKVKDDSFPIIRQELLAHIYNICSNLPCPTCAAHAKEYLNGINFNRIQTKEDLKTMLFTFHNEVNVRKGIPLFPRDQLDEKYSRAVTKNIVYYFLFHFQEKYNNIKIMADNMYRERQSKILQVWLQTNLEHFDM
jgi:hypothetical protein